MVLLMNAFNQDVHHILHIMVYYIESTMVKEATHSRRKSTIWLLYILTAAVAVVDGYRINSPSDRPVRIIHWPSADPVPIQKEIDLLMSGTLLRRGEFGTLQGSRLLEVELECQEIGLTHHQAKCIRKQLMIDKLLKGSWKLKDRKTMERICKDFEHKQKPLLDISYELDLSPVSIFRSIVAPRVLNAYPNLTCVGRNRPAGKIVQSIINEANTDHVNDLLTDWELNELQIAKENDVVGYTDNCSDSAKEWEQIIYTWLDEQNINYITEDTLKQHGYEENGTPDCVLLDDLYINGQQIRWIEFKSFYASGLKENALFTKKAVHRQIEKYNKAYGKSGAMILKRGFSSEVSKRYPSTLFLDGGPLLRNDDYNFF